MKFYYHCNECGREFPGTEILYLCPHCSASNQPKQPVKGVLKVVYNYHELRKLTLADLQQSNFLPLLPISDKINLPPLKVGQTPLYQYTAWERKSLGYHLYLKDDSQNPTFSFKDRASAVVSAFAKENNITTLVAASTGNAGCSLAGICASQGQKALIFVPAKAPIAKLTQVMMYGATLVPVEGTYDDAYDLSVKATELFGWYNRNTAFNPLTIDGKKTVVFELLQQIGTTPDIVFIPTGDGVILAGVYKGFEDLINLGLIEKMPTLVAVQAEKSPNLYNNLFTDRFSITPSTTLADSISVDIPRNFLMAKKYLLQYGGICMTVSDDEIVQASKRLASNTGMFQEPAASAAFAGWLKYAEQTQITAGSRVVVLLTGSGLKDLKSVSGILSMPRPLSPDVGDMKKFLTEQKII